MKNVTNQLLSYMCRDEAEVIVFAEKLAALLQAGDCIALSGDLGAGKTVVCRAIIRTRANDAMLSVASPTFMIMQEYIFSDVVIHHYDLYRIENEDELIEIGFEEGLEERITLVEWPEKAQEIMPENSLIVTIDYCGEQARRLLLDGNEHWRLRLEQLNG